MALGLLCIALQVYFFVLIARMIWSWFPPPHGGLGRRVFEVVLDLTEPVLKLVRGLLPPIRMGGVGLDLSPIVIFIVLGVVRQALCAGRGALL